MEFSTKLTDDSSVNGRKHSTPTAHHRPAGVSWLMSTCALMAVVRGETDAEVMASWLRYKDGVDVNGMACMGAGRERDIDTP